MVVIFNLNIKSAGVLDVIVHYLLRHLRLLLRGLLLLLLGGRLLFLNTTGMLVDVLNSELSHLGLLLDRLVDPKVMFVLFLIRKVSLGGVAHLAVGLFFRVEPPDLESQIVVLKVVSVEALLGEESIENVGEVYQSKRLLVVYFDIFHVSEMAEDCHQIV
jgi:hypothetical protein